MNPDTRRKIVDLKIRISHMDEDYEARKVAIMPAEGWPGSNDAARKASAQKAEYGDEILAAIRADKRALNDELAMTAVEVDIEHEQRKIEELRVRERLSAAIERLSPATVE